MQQADGNDAATQDQQAENRSTGPLVTAGQKLTEGARAARVAISGQSGPFKLRPERKATKRDRHARTRVSFFRYGYYDIAFKFFVEHVLDADFVSLPPSTKRTVELGSKHSSGFVCAPFKHILGDYIEGLERFRAIPCHKPDNPVRVGLVGEYFTAIDESSNLGVEKKLLGMGVELRRMLNMTNRNLRYNEKNLRASASDYITYDMGPTSSMTIAATLKYAQEGFDGVIHMKSSGYTPEIDCMPVMQHISRDMHMPVLYLSYDSQTSDTGLDTRLEAFYDMLAMKKEKQR